MDNTVTQEVFKRIDALAEKLGTTAAYLWPKLVAQYFWWSVGDFVMIFVALPSLFYLFSWLLKNSIRRGKQEPFSDDVHIRVEYFVPACVLGICLIPATWSAYVSIGSTFANLVSPEAAAFYRLVGK